MAAGKRAMYAAGCRRPDLDSHLPRSRPAGLDVLQPEIAGQLRERKIGNIGRTRPDLVATGDPDRPFEVRSTTPQHLLHPELSLLLSTSGSTGSPKLVRLSAANLAANAARYGETVAISGRIEVRSFLVSIDDDGPGIPPESREEVFKPFLRLLLGLGHLGIPFSTSDTSRAFSASRASPRCFHEAHR